MIAEVVAATLAAATHTVSVDITPAHVRNVFDPIRTIGAGVDSQNNGAVKNIYQPQTIRIMLTAGLGPVSYRLYTELSVQHWHWNPRGAWSDPAGQGYWTGSTALGPPITDSYGFRLPHRGFTHDQGNDDDYSRITDGDPASYWKSDPYLTRAYTGESDALHPQWVVVDLGAKRPVDAIRLDWTDPYAVDYQVQHWRGDDAINDPANGQWVTFEKGAIVGGTGGQVTLRLSDAPIDVRFVRVLMTKSSDTCDTHGSKDRRDCVGFALDEVGIGTVDASGLFHDLVVHRADKRQTVTYASSVDPWHARANRVTDQEQAGLDIVYQSGLTRGLPAMVSVGMLYGTPVDAAAEIAYLEKRGYPISFVELGEEPDGQYVLPEDDAALYVQWAAAVHAVDARLRVGGPVFQGVTSDVPVWPDVHGDTSWFHRFLNYLSAHGAIDELQFMSFEHYPFDPCDPSIEQDLLDEPSIVRGIMQTWRADGLPSGIPMFITETNISASAGEPMQDLSGGLWLADFEGAFLTAGGGGSYLYQYEPEPLVEGNCASWGAWGMWAADQHNRIKQPTSQFFAAVLVTQTWAQPVDADESLFPARSDVLVRGRELVTAYALKRPDGAWALLLVNKDPVHAYTVGVRFHDASTGRTSFFNGTVHTEVFGPAQYAWHPDRSQGYANPDGPLIPGTAPGGKDATYVLPAASITVLRAPIAAPM